MDSESDLKRIVYKGRVKPTTLGRSIAANALALHARYRGFESHRPNKHDGNIMGHIAQR